MLILHQETGCQQNKEFRAKPDQNAEVQNLAVTQGAYSQELKLSWECANNYLVTDFEIKRRIAGIGEFEYQQ